LLIKIKPKELNLINKNKVKQNLLLALSVGIIVPLWGTYHSYIGIKIGWVAYVSAAIFFAAGHKLNDSIKIIIGHIIGFGWGVSLCFILSYSKLRCFDGNLILLGTLCLLGILAVVITHIGVNFLSHLPSLFCGWAITVGVMGGVSFQNWNSLPFEVLLSLISGVIFIGISISQFNNLLIRLFNINLANSDKEDAEIKKKPENRGGINFAESKMLKYVTTYKTVNDNQGYSDIEITINDNIFELKKEILDLRNSIYSGSARYSLEENKCNNVSIKIVGVCGSPHKKGSTIVYLKKALNAAESMGNVTTELIELAGKDIKACMGCRTDKCYGKCSINDSMQQIYPILQECDGIILGSPSYFGTFTGQIKLFIDRLRVMRHTDFQLCNKVIAPLSVAGRRHGGQEITNLDLIQSMMRHNTIIVNDGTAVCQLGATGWSHTFDDPNNTVEDDEYGLQTAEGIGKRVAEIAKIIKASGLQTTTYKYNAKIGKRQGG
jgi:multimeric flavodoxin WrbA